MYDTKKKELRWNATYFDYAATLPDEDLKYSKNLIAVFFVFFPTYQLWILHTGNNILIFFSIINRSSCLSDFCTVDVHMSVFILYRP